MKTRQIHAVSCLIRWSTYEDISVTAASLDAIADEKQNTSLVSTIEG